MSSLNLSRDNAQEVDLVLSVVNQVNNWMHSLRTTVHEIIYYLFVIVRFTCPIYYFFTKCAF